MLSPSKRTFHTDKKALFLSSSDLPFSAAFLFGNRSQPRIYITTAQVKSLSRRKEGPLRCFPSSVGRSALVGSIRSRQDFPFLTPLPRSAAPCRKLTDSPNSELTR